MRPSIDNNLGVGVTALKGYSTAAKVAKLEGDDDAVDTGDLAVDDVLVAIDGK